MPITITLPPPHGDIGLGFPITLATSIVDPGPTPYTWQIGIYTDTDFTVTAWFQQSINFSTSTAITIGQVPLPSLFGWQGVLRTGDTAHMRVQLYNDTGQLVDTGTLNATWDATSALPQLTTVNVPRTTGGGLTAEQAAQLERTDSNTQEMDVNWQQYTAVTLPSLQDTLNTITGGITATLGQGAQAVQHFIGELLSWASPDINTDFDIAPSGTCDPVRYDASFQNLQAIGVFIETYPDHYRFVTPDGNWSFRDLAVLSFYRAGTLLERHGIHTLVFSVAPLPGSISPWPVNITFGVQPGDYHIHVDWAPGVCGRVVASTLP